MGLMLVKQCHKPPFFFIKNIWFIHVYTTHKNGGLGDRLFFFKASCCSAYVLWLELLVYWVTSYLRLVDGWDGGVTGCGFHGISKGDIVAMLWVYHGNIKDIRYSYKSGYNIQINNINIWYSWLWVYIIFI